MIIIILNLNVQPVEGETSQDPRDKKTRFDSWNTFRQCCSNTLGRALLIKDKVQLLKILSSLKFPKNDLDKKARNISGWEKWKKGSRVASTTRWVAIILCPHKKNLGQLKNKKHPKNCLQDSYSSFQSVSEAILRAGVKIADFHIFI